MRLRCISLVLASMGNVVCVALFRYCVGSKGVLDIPVSGTVSVMDSAT